MKRRLIMPLGFLLALAFFMVFPTVSAVKVSFGELEQVITGLQQASFVIGVALLFIGILLIIFPGLKTFLGKLVGL